MSGWPVMSSPDQRARGRAETSSASSSTTLIVLYVVRKFKIDVGKSRCAVRGFADASRLEVLDRDRGVGKKVVMGDERVEERLLFRIDKMASC